MEHELSDEHGDELHQVTAQCTKALKDATRATHKALCESHNATIMQKMNTDWADERTFMSEVLTADMVCSLDVGVDAARQRMVRTKDELVWANSAVDNFESRKRVASASHRAVKTERRNADEERRPLLAGNVQLLQAVHLQLWEDGQASDGTDDGSVWQGHIRTDSCERTMCRLKPEWVALWTIRNATSWRRVRKRRRRN